MPEAQSSPTLIGTGMNEPSHALGEKTGPTGQVNVQMILSNVDT
jgi:hypothetical protein